MQSAPITFQQHKNVKRMNMKLNNWIEKATIIITPQISTVVKLIKTRLNEA